MTPEDRQIHEEEAAAERQLRAAAEAMHKAEIKQVAAKARLDNALRATRDVLSRRRAASITGLTAGRVQQIIDSDASSDLSPREARALGSLEPAQLGAVLRELRRESGMTLEDLAGKIDVHTTYLSAVERGRKNPSSAFLGRFIEAFGGRVVAEFDTTGPARPPSGRK
jgi:DNA-binding XRE family transcriptional regulator